MKLTIDVSEVGNCSARQCAFNRDGNCHAQAITIGDSIEPVCDTFIVAAQHSHRQPCGGVGACKVAGCRFNDDLSCQADAIQVTMNPDRPECATFEAR